MQFVDEVVVKQRLDERGASIDEDIPAFRLLERGDVFSHISQDMAVVPFCLLQAAGYDIFRILVDRVGEPGAALGGPVTGKGVIGVSAQ